MGSVLGSYFKIYGAQICPIFTKRATLIRDVTRNEQHSIKSGILYSFNLSQGAKKGIVRGGQYFTKFRILKILSIRSGTFYEQQVITLNETNATFHASGSLCVTEMCNISLDETKVRYVGNIL